MRQRAFQNDEDLFFERYRDQREPLRQGPLWREPIRAAVSVLRDLASTISFGAKLATACLLAALVGFVATNAVLDALPKEIVASRSNSLTLSARAGTLVIARSELASRIPGAMETTEGVARVPANHKPDFVIYGPYWPLAPGQYQGSMELTFGEVPRNASDVCKLDVFSGGLVLS